MKKIESAIIETLKQELENIDSISNYSQWILGVSIRKEGTEGRVVGNPKYTARVVIKTSQSPFVDGMDIGFTVPGEDVLIDSDYFENTPEFQGGTVGDSLRWLKELEEIYYLQLDNPYQLELNLGRLKRTLANFTFEDLTTKNMNLINYLY